MFRIYDTRLFLELHKNYFIREWQHKEADYDYVMKRLPEEQDKVKVTDPNALSEILPLKQSTIEKIFYNQ